MRQEEGWEQPQLEGLDPDSKTGPGDVWGEMIEEGRTLNAEAVNVGLVLKATDSHMEQERDKGKDMLLLGRLFWLCIWAGWKVGSAQDV